VNNDFLVHTLRRRVLLHFSFWIIFILSYSLGWNSGGFTWQYFLLNYLGVLIVYALLIYGTLYCVYGFLIFRKQYSFAFLLFITLLLGTSHVSAWFYNITNSEGHSITLLNYLPFYSFLAAFALALKIARSSYLRLAEELAKKQYLLNQKEYFLRSQIHPHFLFNTLNNFYGLALEKSDELPDYMLRLSNILRHQIYHSEHSKIALEKEIRFLKDYVELQKIRHADNLSFRFLFPETVEANVYITPSILIVFFENAFKHSNTISSQLIEIEGYLKVQQDEMIFYLKNSYPEGVQKAVEESQGLGLKNVKNRLSLLGDNSCILHTSKQKGIFTVELTLKLMKP
jgi:two-component system LytT family sensor kinase